MIYETMTEKKKTETTNLLRIKEKFEQESKEGILLKI